MIYGKNIYLRGVELSDVPELMKYWNNRELKRFLHAITPHAIQEEEEWVRKTWSERRKGKSYVFAVVLVDSNLYIGNVEVSIMDTLSRRGNLGIAIFNPNYWSKGHGTEAIGMILGYSFTTLNLHSVQLSVFSNNPRAQRCYEKNGFKKTGVRREALYSDGEYLDIYLLDITKNEWKERNS
ncbi:MAG: GNAT family N-acetyltransferase [Candidatus Hodarchaeales archaeon]|jgi:RimJ/RimL family protein N-acetyltransferase